jgi:hypothetical protein
MLDRDIVRPFTGMNAQFKLLDPDEANDYAKAA